MNKTEHIKELYFKKGIRDYNLIIKEVGGTTYSYVYKVISKAKKQGLNEEIKPEGFKDVTIGADIEFLFSFKDLNIINADSLLKNRTGGRVGTDGCYSTGEMRPKQENDAFKLVKNIKRCLDVVNTTLHKKGIDGYIVTGSGLNNRPIGGHIHLGFFGDYDNLISCLDMVSLLVMHKDNKKLFKERLQRGYGQLHAHRRQRWGVEYRTPYSYLKNPSFSIGLLSLYHCVTLEYVNNPNSNAIKGLIKLYESIPNIQDKYNTGFDFKKYFPEIIKNLTLMTTLKNNINGYKSVIMDFLDNINETEENDVIVVNKEKWNLNVIEIKTEVFNFGRDDFLDIIQKEVGKIKINGEEQKYSVIGIGENWNNNIIVGKQNTIAYKILKEYAENKGLTIGVDNRRGLKIIGFDYDLREQHRGDIIRLLKEIGIKEREKAKQEVLIKIDG